MLCLRFSEEMSKKSVVVGLPIVPFNQNKQSDVCKYLEYIQDFCTDIFKVEEVDIPKCTHDDLLLKLKYKEAVLKGITVPLSGDLLGRERVTGAKRARLGCNHRVERFENIVENVAQYNGIQSSHFFGYVMIINSRFQLTFHCKISKMNF